MRDTKNFTPKKIFEPIGMTGDRFRYALKLGLITPDAKRTKRAGSANLFSAREACKAALINWCDKIGHDLSTAESLIAFAFQPEALKLILADGPDYYAMSQGHTVLAMLPNIEQMPGGVEAGREVYPAGSIYKIRPLDGVTLFAPVEYKDHLRNGATVTYINLSLLFRFFGMRIGFTFQDIDEA